LQEIIKTLEYVRDKEDSLKQRKNLDVAISMISNWPEWKKYNSESKILNGDYLTNVLVNNRETRRNVVASYHDGEWVIDVLPFENATVKEFCPIPKKGGEIIA